MKALSRAARGLFEYVKKEPVRTYTIIQTGLGALAAFGLDFSAEQMAALLLFAGAGLELIVRRTVSPTAKG